MAWTLHRIIRDQTPELLDFTSLTDQGIAPRSDNPEVVRLNQGISCWSTEAQARRTVRKYPNLGSYIAVLQIPDDATARVERTLGPGHHTVWGDPEELMRYVQAILLV
jgi:hypothetical protein